MCVRVCMCVHISLWYSYGSYTSTCSLKGLYHRRIFIQVCLQIDPESYEWCLSARSDDLK